jgi:dolichyl-phosphate-mannose--protein O-mannosyl transferase
MILELLFLFFVTCTVFFGMRALRALIIRRWVEDALAEGILIEQQENDDAPSK